jgi:hypothetical protein
MQSITIKHKSNEIQQTTQSHILNLFRVHKKTITIGITMISTILVIGYLLNNISSPNATMGSIFDPLPVYKNGLGAVNGYVVGSPEFPILGTIMVAAEQSGQFRTVSMGLEPDGKYVFQDLNPGEYTIIAYFPNGEYKVMNNIEVEANPVKSLIF